MKYAKTIVAALAAAAVALQVALTDSTVTQSEWVQIGVAALAAVGVFLIPNKPAEPVPPQT